MKMHFVAAIIILFIYSLSVSELLAEDNHTLTANLQNDEVLVGCAGIGYSTGLYCQWDGCFSLDEGFLSKGTCPEKPFYIKETTEKVFNEASWGRMQLAELAAEKGPDESIVLHASLDDTYEFPSLATANDQEMRLFMIEERKKAMATDQYLAELILEELGGIVYQRTWLVPGVIAEVPASSVNALLNEPLFFDLNPAGDKDFSLDSVPNEGWGGLDVTDGTLSEDLYQLDYKGETGGRVSSPSDNIKIGVSEVDDDSAGPNYINCSHVGWNDWYAAQNPPTRLQKATICDSVSCYGSACDSATSRHATRVAWAALGSIEQGQDQPTYSGVHTDAQRRRSGVASEADLYFYYLTGNCGILTGLQQAVQDGVDVYNMSWTRNDTHCDLASNPCSMNTALESAADDGVMLIASAGNNNAANHNGCSVQWPGTRSSVLSVNGLASKLEGTPYEDLVRIYWTATGKTTIQVVGGANRDVPLVDILAPGAINWYFTTGTNSYANMSNCGTSVASPIVSAIAGLTREWMNDLGWYAAAANARQVLTNIMAMGDGYTGDLNDSSQEYSTTVSERSGYGRIRTHLPLASSLGGSGWGWSTGYNWLSTGNVRYHALPGNPQPTSIEGVKAAVAWYDSDYQDVGDLKVQIVDLCPPGGGMEVLKTAQTSHTMRKRIQLKSDADIHGRCLYLRMEGLAASGEMYYFAMYSYSNLEVFH